MINIFKHVLVNGVTALAVVIGGNAYSGEWMDCVPYRVAARINNEIHVGCENVPGWYFVKSTPENKDYIDRVLYLGTSAIIAGKSLKLEVPKVGESGDIIAIELFK